MVYCYFREVSPIAIYRQQLPLMELLLVRIKRVAISETTTTATTTTTTTTTSNTLLL